MLASSFARLGPAHLTVSRTCRKLAGKIDYATSPLTLKRKPRSPQGSGGGVHSSLNWHVCSLSMGWAATSDTQFIVSLCCRRHGAHVTQAGPADDKKPLHLCGGAQKVRSASYRIA